jgi:hypothetical protein
VAASGRRAESIGGFLRRMGAGGYSKSVREGLHCPP